MTHKFHLVIATTWEVSTTADPSEIEKAKRNVIDILNRETPEFASFAKRTKMNIQELP